MSLTLKQLDEITTVLLRSTWKVVTRSCWRTPSSSTSSLTNVATACRRCRERSPSTSVCRRETPDVHGTLSTLYRCSSSRLYGLSTLSRGTGCLWHDRRTVPVFLVAVSTACRPSIVIHPVIRHRAESMNFASLPACSAAGYSNTFN